jgi:hypothetical protein
MYYGHHFFDVAAAAAAASAAANTDPNLRLQVRYEFKICKKII